MKNVPFKMLVIMVFALLLGLPAKSQTTWKEQTGMLGINLGINTIILADAYSMEANYTHKRMIFSLNYIASLDHEGSGLIEEISSQKVALHNPYVTGFGFGFKFTNWLNARIEPRWSRYQFYYETDNQKTDKPFLTYNTFSCGFGIHAFLKPFGKRDNALKGIAIIPRFNFWPNITNSRKGADYEYFNTATGKLEVIPVLPVGIFQTPFIGEIAIGYFFNSKK